MLPRLPYTKSNYKKNTINFTGINRTSSLDDSEFSSTTNLSTESVPIITNRPSREVTQTLTSPTALFPSIKLCTIDGTDFKYDGVAKGTVTAGAKCMVDFNGRIVIFPDKKAYDYVADTFATFGTGEYPAVGSVPDIDYACVLDNRIFAVKGDVIYATALGEYDNWTKFEGVATDSYTVDTGTNGSFTGIASYKGSVLAFKADRVFKLFGSLPSDPYQFVEISKMGCVNNKSICEVDNLLYYLNAQGIAAYGGGSPEIISEKLNENYTSAVAGTDGRRYYISLYNGTTYNLYVLDTAKGLWIREDSLQVVDFAFYDGSLYALSSDGKLYKFNSGTERVEWELISKPFTEEINEHKGYSELSFRAELEANSVLFIYVKVDNGGYELVKSYSVDNLTSFIVPIKFRKADHFTIKLNGKGNMKIYSMQRKFHVYAR